MKLFSIRWFIHFSVPHVCDSLTTEQMHPALPVAWAIEDRTHKHTMQAHLWRGYEVHREFVNIQNQPFHETNGSVVWIFQYSLKNVFFINTYMCRKLMWTNCIGFFCGIINNKTKFASIKSWILGLNIFKISSFFPHSRSHIMCKSFPTQEPTGLKGTMYMWVCVCFVPIPLMFAHMKSAGSAVYSLCTAV